MGLTDPTNPSKFLSQYY